MSDVLLFTRDNDLARLIDDRRPPALALSTLTTEPRAHEESAGAEQWIDLDDHPDPRLPSTGRRVYFHRDMPQSAALLPPGLFIRKPCKATVLDVLWAGVRARRRIPAHRSAHTSSRDLPAWLAEFHTLDLRQLGRLCVSRLPTYMGYRSASVYLYEPAEQVLRLLDCTHTEPIDREIPVHAGSHSIMATVAQQPGFLRTADISNMVIPCGGLRDSRRTDNYDGSCLVAPLSANGELQAVLNLTHARDTLGNNGGRHGALVDRVPLTDIFAFLGRAFAFARSFGEMSAAARHDCLTGLFNYRWAREALAREVNRAERYHSALAVLLVDLDDLKVINDVHGHLAGDQALRHVADRIRHVLRRMDAAARIGGDEFLLVLPHTDQSGAQFVARRLQASFALPADLAEGVRMPVRASIGPAIWQPGWTVQQLWDAADQAMYAFKRRAESREAPMAARLAISEQAFIAAPPRTP